MFKQVFHTKYLKNGSISPELMERKNHLKEQEERIKKAFLENEAAEKETEKKLRHSWHKSQESVESVASTVELAAVETGLDNLSKHIVDKLLMSLSKEPGESPMLKKDKSSTSLSSAAAARSDSDCCARLEESLRQKRKEVRQVQDSARFARQEAVYQAEQLQAAVAQERQQTLNLMQKLNDEKQSKLEVQEELYTLQDDVGDLQTQLVRHRDEIEEVTSLYEAEKLQNLVLEEAMAAEKENFNALTRSLADERQRAGEAAARDQETILELRTALEVQKEQQSRAESRLGPESPYPGKRSAAGSRQSLQGSRQSLARQQSLVEELQQERARVDRLKECLELEREKGARLADTSEQEVAELLARLEEEQQEQEAVRRQLDTAETDKLQLLQDLQTNNERIEKLEIQISSTRPQDLSGSKQFYVEDLESKLEAYREREAVLESELQELRAAGSAGEAGPVLPAGKTQSFGGHFRGVPEEPHERAVFFFRRLLRSESYRKALVWQKRYLSLLLCSYQESELLSLGRLARMAGGRRMLVADLPRPEGTNLQFKVVVHAVVAIQRMKFLVRRWKKSRSTAARKSCSPNSDRRQQQSVIPAAEVNISDKLQPSITFIN